MKFLLCFFLLFVHCLATAQYNELKDENGDVRPHYEEAYNALNELGEKKRRSLHHEAKRRFHGDNAFSLLPRIIEDEENTKILIPGVRQRAKAIRAFLKDHRSGKKTYLDSGIIAAAHLDEIIKRSGEHHLQELTEGDEVSFWYGPDIMRDETGVWRVVEDNHGLVGGFGDLPLSHEFLFEKLPQLAEISKTVDPYEFYRKMVEGFKMLSPVKDGIVVLANFPPYWDNEDQRMTKIFKSMGVEIVSNYTQAKLDIRPRGVFLKKPNQAPQKVGYVIINGEWEWMDSTSPETRPFAITKEAMQLIADPKRAKALRAELAELLEKYNQAPTRKKLEPIRNLLLDHWNLSYYWQLSRSPVNGLYTAVKKGHVRTNISLGIDFVGDKEFYMYMEDFIRFYLNEEPILKNLKSFPFAVWDQKTKSFVINEVGFQRALKDKNKYVVKGVTGRGGDEVWIGSKMISTEWKKIMKMVKENPSHFKGDEFTAFPVLDGNLVDVRYLANVGPSGPILVSEVPWGRFVIASGDGKVNVSKNGGVQPVIIHKKNPCSRVLQ